jgi:flagellar motor switch protein FliG
VSTALMRAGDVDRLSGRQKAAVLCMALGTEFAAKITQKLSAEEVEAISLEIARMEHASGPLAEAVLAEWLEIAAAAKSIIADGGVEYAREMLEKAFGPQKAAAMLKRIQSQLADTAGLHRLRTADPQQLGNMLRGEHPQTIALILAHLEPPHTAAVFREFEPSLGSEVVFRMARMEKVSPDLLQLIERSLSADTDLAPSQGSASGGPAAVAAVLNLISASLEKELLDGVAAKDAVLCEQIKNLMFVFEDITSLDDKALQRILREIDSKQLALALKVSSEELKSRMMGAMTQRAREALKDEMDMLGPVRVRDVEAAQAEIVAQVRKLEESGEIVIGGGSDDMVS